jgi:hypothetical protein
VFFYLIISGMLKFGEHNHVPRNLRGSRGDTNDKLQSCTVIIHVACITFHIDMVSYRYKPINTPNRTPSGE